ncbi:MAG TPA: hypothetical protein VF530_13655 [Planctomycetota bacterium]
MELLHAPSLRPEPGERVFRHPRLGYLLVLPFLCAPLGVAVLLLPVLDALPWAAWLLLGPVFAFGGALYALVLASTLQGARRAFGRTNWLLRVSPAGLVLNLRSFQNAHFPEDGPTVARLAWPEVARAREVREPAPGAEHAASVTARWLQLELAGVDTAPLEALVRAERERPGPARRFLGITGRSRSGHVPVWVAAPGIVRCSWPGREALRALEPSVSCAEPLVLAPDAEPDLERRLAELVRRGERLRAIAHARAELGLSTTEARARIDELARRVA